MWFLFDLCMAVIGYIASVYTWPMLRTQVQGIQAEIQSLESRIVALKNAATIKPT